MHLLLLPGMDGTGLLFEPLRRALPDGWQATVVRYPVDQALGYAELLPFVMDAVPAGRDFLVVAESFSGPLAVMLAAKRPSGLRGVVLCALFVRFPLSAPWKWLAGRAAPWWFRLASQAVARRLLLGSAVRDELRQLFEQALNQVEPAVMAARLRAVATIDVTEELRQCSVPLLYLAASNDLVVPPSCHALIRSICPQAELVTLPGPHLLLQAAPLQGAAAIQQFFAGSAATAVP